MRSPGFAPWGMLLEIDPPRLDNRLADAVRHKAHWEHVRFLFDDQDAYRGLLRLQHVVGFPETEWHEDLERLVKKCFFPPIKIVRGPNCWLAAETLAPRSSNGLTDLLESLPAVQALVAKKDGTPKVVVSKSALGHFRGEHCLARYGYPSVIPTRGVDVAANARPDDPHRIFAPAPINPPFRYREGGVEEAEDAIRQRFPGVNPGYLRLLIGAVGLNQTGITSDAPVIFATGQSGAGKTMTGYLAAAILRTSMCEGRLPSDPDEQRMHFGEMSGLHSIIGYSECKSSSMTGDQIRAACLSFTRGVTYRKLYVGNLTVDTPAAVLITNPTLAVALRNDPQTARRIVHVELDSGANATGKNWQQMCETGCVKQWLTHPIGVAMGHNNWADAIISDVMRRWFRDPTCIPSFEQIANDCGFKLLRESDEINVVREQLQELYKLVIAMPERSEEEAARDTHWRGPGWRVFHEGSPAGKLWSALAPNGDTEEIVAANWSVITGQAGMGVRTHKYGAKIGVRFLINQ